MKIKLLKSGKICLGNGFGEIVDFKKGEIGDFDDVDSKTLIDHGWGKEFVEKSEKPVSSKPVARKNKINSDDSEL